MTFEHQYEVKIKDLGLKNEMTNKAFLDFMEEIASLHSSTVGRGVNEVEENGQAWVLMDWKVKVIKRPKFSEKLTVKTWARDTTKLYSYRDYEVYNEKEELVAIGSSKWVLIDINKRRIIKIEDELINKYNPEPGHFVFDELDIEKIKEPENYISNIEYVVKRQDIDVNNHMHNLNYLDLAYETLPEDVYYKRNELKNIRITYKKEITLGDTVKCYYSNENDSYFITIKSYDDKTVHAIIKLN